MHTHTHVYMHTNEQAIVHNVQAAEEVRVQLELVQHLLRHERLHRQLVHQIVVLEHHIRLVVHSADARTHCSASAAASAAAIVVVVASPAPAMAVSHTASVVHVTTHTHTYTWTHMSVIQLKRTNNRIAYKVMIHKSTFTHNQRMNYTCTLPRSLTDTHTNSCTAHSLNHSITQSLIDSLRHNVCGCECVCVCASQLLVAVSADGILSMSRRLRVAFNPRALQIVPVTHIHTHICRICRCCCR